MDKTKRDDIVAAYLAAVPEGGYRSSELKDQCAMLKVELRNAGADAEDITDVAADLLAMTLDDERLTDADVPAYVAAICDGFGVEVVQQEPDGDPDDPEAMNFAVRIRRDH